MKIALVHDYLNEFGGAERVLLALSEMYPKAPIFTAFCKKGSAAEKRFFGKDIRESWASKIPFFAGKLHSPLRFLAPLIWGSFAKELKKYDVVISSSSWYVTKGFGEICYCHTPPRWLYGYKTSMEWQRFWLVRVYGQIVGHFMRQYDFNQAQKVDYFIANSREVQSRIEKFYRRKARVIYPPVELPVIGSDPVRKEDYYLVISRLVGGKGLELAIKAAVKLGVKLKIAGKGAGWGSEEKRLKKLLSDKIEMLGEVSDKELVELYSKAKGFLALAENEDFGITPVEAMSCGTGVIAYKGGGYLETVIEGKTGVFFEEQTVESLVEAMKRFEKMKIKSEECVKQAKKFSRERFEKEIKEFVAEKIRGYEPRRFDVIE
jgi:glycosyltransferase involved in cell wall biosynthesis